MVIRHGTAWHDYNRASARSHCAKCNRAELRHSQLKNVTYDPNHEGIKFSYNYSFIGAVLLVYIQKNDPDSEVRKAQKASKEDV